MLAHWAGSPARCVTSHLCPRPAYRRRADPGQRGRAYELTPRAPAAAGHHDHAGGVPGWSGVTGWSHLCLPADQLLCVAGPSGCCCKGPDQTWHLPPRPPSLQLDREPAVRSLAAEALMGEHHALLGTGHAPPAPPASRPVLLPSLPPACSEPDRFPTFPPPWLSPSTPAGFAEQRKAGLRDTLFASSKLVAFLARQLPARPELLAELADLLECGQRSLALAIVPQVGGRWARVYVAARGRSHACPRGQRGSVAWLPTAASRPLTPPTRPLTTRGCPS